MEAQQDITQWMLDPEERQEELSEVDLIINELLLDGSYRE